MEYTTQILSDMLTPLQMKIMRNLIECSIVKEQVIESVREDKYNYYYPLYLLTKNQKLRSLIYNRVKKIRSRKLKLVNEYGSFMREMKDKNMFSSKEKLMEVLDIARDRLKEGNYLKFCDLCYTIYKKLSGKPSIEDEDEYEPSIEVLVERRVINGETYLVPISQTHAFIVDGISYLQLYDCNGQEINEAINIETGEIEEIEVEYEI